MTLGKKNKQLHELTAQKNEQMQCHVSPLKVNDALFKKLGNMFIEKRYPAQRSAMDGSALDEQRKSHIT